VKRLLQAANFSLKAHHPAIILPLGNDRWTRWSEKFLTRLFGKTWLANFGVRHFYIASK
jgi:hypothetical protein